MRNFCCVRFKKVSTPLAVFCPASALIRFMSFFLQDPPRTLAFVPGGGHQVLQYFAPITFRSIALKSSAYIQNTFLKSPFNPRTRSSTPLKLLQRLSARWSGAECQYPIIRLTWVLVQSRLPETCCQHLLMGQVVSPSLLCNFLGPPQTVTSELHRQAGTIPLSKFASSWALRSKLFRSVPEPPRQVVVARSQLAELASGEASALSCDR